MEVNKIRIPLPILIIWPLEISFSFFYPPYSAFLNSLSLGLVFLFSFVCFFAANPFLLPKNIALFKYFEKITNILKLLLISGIIFITVFYPLMQEIQARVQFKSYDIHRVHDGIIQTEEAVKKLLAGHNPYSENYFGTPLEQWEPTQDNPALFHYVYLPFQILLFVPFQLVSNNLFGVFDGRIILLILQVFVFIGICLIPRKIENKLIFLILYFINPLFERGFVWGHNDLLIFAFLLFSIILLVNKKPKLSMVLLALACGIKQQALFFVPFYFAYLLAGDFSFRNIKTWIARLWPFWLTTAIIFLPFILWNPLAFWNSTVGYLAGTAENSYYAAGFGFSTILHLDQNAYFPFWIIQLGITIVVLPWFIILMKKYKNLKLAIVLYTLFTFLIIYFGRYFYHNHIFALIWILLVAYFLPEPTNNEAENNLDVK